MNNLDKQYTDLVNDSYKNYVNSDEVRWPKSKEEFINKIKTDDGFAKKWGVKVEIRELSDEERIDWMRNNKSKVFLPTRDPNVEFSMDEFFRPYGVPKRAISLTYNNQTIEIYE